MNTSKSLDSILRKLLGHDDPVEIGNGYHDDCAEEIAEAKQAIVEAVEGLIPQQKSVTKMNGAFYKSEFQQIKGYNTAIAEMLQAIKEWQ